MSHIRASVTYSLDAVRLSAAGEIVAARPLAEGRNMLTDGGLNELVNRTWVNLFAYFQVGTGSDPIKRDSGGITFTQAGNTVTASAAFFDALDVGRVLVLDGDGVELRITSRTSSTVAVVGGAARNFGPVEGTIHYVNRTALSAAGPLAAFSTLGTNSGAHGSSWDGVSGVFSTWVTRISAAVAANTMFTEICWRAGSSGGVVSGIASINGGAGAYMLTGEQLRVRLQLDRTIAPITPVAVPAPVVAGVNRAAWDVSAQYVAENIMLSKWNAAGVETQGALFDPSQNKNCVRLDTATALRAPKADYDYSGTMIGTPLNSQEATPQGYTANSFARDYVATYPVSAANGVWRAVCFGYENPTNNPPTVSYGLRMLFAGDCVKTADDTLSFTFRLTWGRTLVN